MLTGNRNLALQTYNGVSSGWRPYGLNQQLNVPVKTNKSGSRKCVGTRRPCVVNSLVATGGSNARLGLDDVVSAFTRLTRKIGKELYPLKESNARRVHKG
jgi:hypothetical protein